MPFYITRALPSGPIRFGVGERTSDPDSGPTATGFSTGPSGEYLRLRPGSHFYSDSATSTGDALGAAAIAPSRERTIPIWGWASIGFGALLILLGLLVVANKGYTSGYVEAAVGAAFIALPFVMTAAKRAELRRRIAKERAEREAEEARLRETAGGYADAAARLRSARDETVLREIRTARQGKDLPPEVIARSGKPAVLRAGFEALTRWDEEGPGGVANAIRRTADATGITPEDEADARLAVAQRAWWHLLADDRIDDGQKGRLEALARALGIEPAALEAETEAAVQFERLRGLDPRNLPQVDPPLRMRALESCLHRTRGRVTSLRRERKVGNRVLVEGGWKEGPEEDVVVTNQRLLVRGGKALELDVRTIRELEVDIDRGILAVIAKEEREKAHYLRLPDPIYTAGLLDAATQAPHKPKGLV